MHISTVIRGGQGLYDLLAVQTNEKAEESQEVGQQPVHQIHP